SQLIAAPAKRAYDAWLNPADLARFMVPCEEGSVPSASADARVGGRFLIVMRVGDKDIPHSGTYLELKPHSRIRFTWESPHSIDGSEVTLDFVPEGAGTRIMLSQVRFHNEASRDGHIAGWHHILETFALTMVRKAA
ncbi:MAG TPA: SRPBCC domain-containing protein, partial [Paracoccaceae bacterium]|nr:SRPBCC domain-containing protein [Paracoccaceae bacterium]